MAVVYYDSRGQRRVHGGKDLKQSQEYPKEHLDSFDVLGCVLGC